jgi:hypothetical protein
MRAGRLRLPKLKVVKGVATAVVAVLAVATLVTALLSPNRAVPDPVLAVVGERLVGCPAGDPVFGETNVAGVGAELTWSELGGEASEPVTRFDVTDPDGALVVTGDQSMGVLGTAIQHDTLTGQFCGSPASTGWWDGVWASDHQESALILTNVDSAGAVVTITVITETGQLSVPGLRSIPINPHETRTIDLKTFLNDAGIGVERPVSISLTAETGRVVAYLRSQGELGQDWRQSSVAPSTALVIPGVPTTAGEGESSSRFLFITNHGDQPARLEILGQGSGAAVPIVGRSDSESDSTSSTLVVRPRTMTVLDLSTALAGETIGVIVNAVPYHEGDDPQPVTATLVVAGTDIGSVAAQPAMSGGMTIPAIANSSLVVTNPSSDSAIVQLSYLDEEGQETDLLEYEVPQGTLDIPVEADTGSIAITVRGGSVRAVLVVSQIGETAGLIVAPLGAGGASGLNVTIGYDPTLG